jgi:hypothetical protein
MITSTSLSAGVSFVFNISDLIQGNIWTFTTNIAKDTAISASSSGLSIACENIPVLAEGSGVIIIGLIDGVNAIQTGDWSRFGLNIGLNTCATIGAVGAGKGGAAVGTAIWPGAGTIVGGLVGGIIGGL